MTVLSHTQHMQIFLLSSSAAPEMIPTLRSFSNPKVDEIFFLINGAPVLGKPIESSLTELLNLLRYGFLNDLRMACKSFWHLERCTIAALHRLEFRHAPLKRVPDRS